MIKNIFFDMDGTLINMDQEEFIKVYYGLLAKRLAELGYENAKEIAKIVLGSSKIMAANNGEKLNSEVFFDYMKKTLNFTKEELEAPLQNFYETDFNKAQVTTSKIEGMDAAIKTLKAKGIRLFLTTNPMFPKVAIVERLHWAGLNENDFDYIPSYDTCRFAKPNPGYYEDVIKNFNLNPSETLLVGNDYEKDIIPAFKLGLRSYYLTQDNIDKKVDLAGTHKDFMEFVNGIK